MFGTCYNAILMCEGLKTWCSTFFSHCKTPSAARQLPFSNGHGTWGPQKGTRSSLGAIINVIGVSKASQLTITAVRFVRVLSSATGHTARKGPFLACRPSLYHSYIAPNVALTV